MLAKWFSKSKFLSIPKVIAFNEFLKLQLQPLTSDAKIVQLTQKCCYATNLRVASRSTQLMTLIATHCVKDMIQIDGMDATSEAVMAIEALFLLINSQGSTQNDATMKILKVKNDVIQDKKKIGNFYFDY